ncbi:MAG: GNAT family N-acetyltransferase [Saprospiraceae bacterium]|nr:GNAT family N-acetyltransferase [Pyrinomonadaceae bacterium]
MDQVTIRQATLADLDTLLSFEQALINFERPLDATIKAGNISYYDLENMISAASVKIVVAESAGEIVGCGYASIEDSKPYLAHRQHAYLGFMYVVPEHRGNGVNRLIMDELKRWSVSKGVTHMRLEVFASNPAAIKAYEKVGFASRLLEMTASLDEL